MVFCNARAGCDAGNSNRATAHTDMNHHSSRSHAILQLWLEQRPSSQDSKAAGVVVRSKMNFVDLAGSERWGKAHTEAEGRTLINELTSINNSLSALAMVVSALTDKAAKHIPYRSVFNLMVPAELVGCHPASVVWFVDWVVD